MCICLGHHWKVVTIQKAQWRPWCRWPRCATCLLQVTDTRMIQVKKLRTRLRRVLHSTSKETCGGKETNLFMFLSSALLLGVSFVLLDWLAHAKVGTSININAGQILAMISTLSPFRVVVDFQSVRTCGCHWESNARLIWMLPAKAPSSPSLMRMSWKLSCTQSLNGSAWLTFRWSVKRRDDCQLSFWDHFHGTY